MDKNSLKAYRELNNLPESKARVLRKFLDNGAYGLLHEGYTDRQVKDMFIPPLEMDQVRPRITGLIEDGVLFKCGNTTCTKTNKTVRLVRAV